MPRATIEPVAACIRLLNDRSDDYYWAGTLRWVNKYEVEIIGSGAPLSLADCREIRRRLKASGAKILLVRRLKSGGWIERRHAL